MNIVYFVSEDYYFCSHRMPIARAAKQAGHRISVLTRVNNHGDVIKSAGFELIDLNFDRSSLGLIQNLKLLLKLIKLFKSMKIDILHNVAIKPIVFGTLAAKLSSRKTKVINAFAGLGYVFTARTLKANLIRTLLTITYKIIFHSQQVLLLFQNHDDEQFFQQRRLAKCKQTVVIPGSGVDTDYFKPEVDAGLEQNPFTIVMVSRLLRDKGIYEFLDAAKAVKAICPEIQFALAGQIDDKNPSSLTATELQSLVDEGVVTYLGQVDDVRTVFRQAHVVVLPSYREGLPKVLLEASACQKAIITTDVPGCRELIQNERNGLIVPARDVFQLQQAMLRLYEDRALLQALAMEARDRVVKSFSEPEICKQTIALYSGYSNSN